MMSFIRTALLAVCVIGLSAHVQASIFNVSGATGFFPGGTVQIKVENYENIKVDGGTPGVLDVGDSLRGIIRITSTTQGADQYQPDGTFELTGIFETVVTKRDVYVAVPELATFQFGPSTTFASDLATITGRPVTDFTGAMLAFFEGSPADWLTDTTSVATAEADATDGSLFAVLGAGSGVWGTDWYWGAEGPTAIALNGLVNTQFAASLNLIVNETGLVFDDGITQTPTTQVGVSYGFGLGAILNEFGLKGSVKPTSSPDPTGIYALRSDDPAIASTIAIPEPTGLLVWMGLLAATSLAGRRASKLAN